MKAFSLILSIPCGLCPFCFSIWTASLLFINNLNLKSREWLLGVCKKQSMKSVRVAHFFSDGTSSVFLVLCERKKPFAVGLQLTHPHNPNPQICLGTGCLMISTCFSNKNCTRSFLWFSTLVIHESFEELSKILISKPLPGWIKSETLGKGPSYEIFQYL